MEAIAAAASIFSLLQVLGSVENGIQFLSRYHNTTSDFHRLSEQIANLKAKLQFIEIVKRWATSCDSLLEEQSSTLETCLLAAQNDISYVLDVCLKTGTGKKSVVKRLKWAIRNGHIWNELTPRLQDAHNSLLLTLQIINMSVCPVPRSSLVANIV